MSHWRTTHSSKVISPSEAIGQVKNGARIYLGSMCSEPKTMIEALSKSYVEDVQMVQFLSGRAATSLAETCPERFSLKTFFVGRRSAESRRHVEADHVPLFHSQIPNFLRMRRIPIDIAIVQVSEPDRFGRFSLGISVDTSLAAVQSARVVIAQVNSRMPRTHGDTVLTEEDLDYLVPAEEELDVLPEEQLGDRERTISRYCAELIDDGAVVHFGFTGISRGLMDCFTHHRHLGLHTEILTDPLVDLIEKGVIDNRNKRMYRGKSVATCCMGTRKVYDFVHENSAIEFFPSDVVLNPSFIATNDRMVAVNLGLQVDLRGHVRQGSPTWTAFEGSGGDHDFMRGASLAEGGRSIVCLRSTSPKRGLSTIVPSFGPDAAVMMNRGEVGYVITEYGIAYLGGKSIRERAAALIEIAHPDHREDLTRRARELGYVYPDHYYCMTANPALRKRVRTDRMFKGGVQGHVRVIKPTDEQMIRDLFYNLSEEAVYFRYFSPRRAMPHANLVQYVNLSEDEGLSIVVTHGPRENRRIIGEARYIVDARKEYGEVAFMVDEAFHGHGIGTFLLEYLIEIAKERGLKGFSADVLVSNLPMLKMFHRVPYVVHKSVSEGAYSIRFRFDELKAGTNG
ncbi:MAG: GNAT family N-acetyltransferase [Thermodesulfobacteriota bacterium]